MVTCFDYADSVTLMPIHERERYGAGFAMFSARDGYYASAPYVAPFACDGVTHFRAGGDVAVFDAVMMRHAPCHVVLLFYAADATPLSRAVAAAGYAAFAAMPPLSATCRHDAAATVIYVVAMFIRLRAIRQHAAIFLRYSRRMRALCHDSALRRDAAMSLFAAAFTLICRRYCRRCRFCRHLPLYAARCHYAAA